MDALADLEEVAEQAAFSINPGTRQSQTKTPGSKWGHAVPANLTNSKVAREKPQPAATPSLPDAAPEAHRPEIVFTGVEVTCYSELIGGIQARLGALGIRQVDFDKLASFADGLSGKIFGSGQVRRLGVEKMFDALRAAGLKLRLEPDPQQLQRMQKQIAENCIPRQEKQARPHNQANLDQRTVDRVLIYLTTKKGGIARLHDAVKDARSNWARHAAKARHAKAKPHFGSISLSAVHALPPPDNRPALDSCAEEEATAA
jgi:hypothetical protein